MHISCRAARAFTLRRERNEWMYTARTVIAALIITRRKIGLRRCNKCARERNKRRVRMTNCQTISVPSSVVIKDGTTINPVTTSLVPASLSPSSRGIESSQSGTMTKKLSPKRSQFLAIRCGITDTRDTRARYYVSRGGRCSTNPLWDVQFNLVRLIATLSLCMESVTLLSSLRRTFFTAGTKFYFIYNILLLYSYRIFNYESLLEFHFFSLYIGFLRRWENITSGYVLYALLWESRLLRLISNVTFLSLAPGNSTRLAAS